MQGAAEFSTSGMSDALVILGAAGIVIPAFARFKISPVIGFILIGLAVGPAGLGSIAPAYPWLHYVTISNAEAIQPFAEIGIILLLFSIGLELSFRRLWKMRRLVFGVGAAELLVSAAIIGAVIHLIGQSWAGALGLGLALALSSTAVVLPLVGASSAVGRSAFSMLLFEDLALVPIVFVLGVLGPFGATDGWAGALDVLWMGGLTIAAMLVAGRLFLPSLFAQAARSKSPELFLSAALLVAILASMMTTAVGLSPFAGALLAGILIAETEYRGEVEVVTAPFRGLGLGIFLITVGMSVDMRLVFGSWQHIFLAVLAVLVIKAVVTGVLLRLEGASRGVAAETGVLMAAPSETTLIVLGAASAAQLIQPQTAAFWQIVTAIGLTITPLLAYLGRFAGQRVEKKVTTRVAQTMQSGGTSKVVILGFGRVGQMVAEMLKGHGKDFVAIDADIDTVAVAAKAGSPVIFGDVSHPDVIERIQRGKPSAFILTMDNPVLAARLVKRLRRTFPDMPIIARARDTAHAARLYKAGATDAVPETLESSLQLSEAVLVDLGVAMGPVIASIHEKREELRAQIKAAAEMEDEPRLGRRRLRDAG
jgi:monovalent cation:H+ antiporter-2, CPA2 family